MILRKKFHNKKIALFMDNLRVHHTHRVRDYCEINDISLIYNLAYYPEGNPIEITFSKVKHLFTCWKTNDIVNGHKSSTRMLIDKAFSQISLEECQNAISKCLYILSP